MKLVAFGFESRFVYKYEYKKFIGEIMSVLTVVRSALTV